MDFLWEWDSKYLANIAMVVSNELPIFAIQKKYFHMTKKYNFESMFMSSQPLENLYISFQITLLQGKGPTEKRTTILISQCLYIIDSNH